VKQDKLYTLRWLSKEVQKSESIERSKELGKEIEAMLTETINGKRETPLPGETMRPKLALIVGHTEKAPGASMATGGSEYDYNKRIANLCAEYVKENNLNLDLKIVYRDQIGLRGAYDRVASLNVDACIELHFNAFNKQVTGTETLCSPKPMDKEFAAILHEKICRVFHRDNDSRGVKIIPRGANGGFAVYSLGDIPNCLVEPFFGDVLEEANMALAKEKEYAESLVLGTAQFFDEIGVTKWGIEKT
jgi:N-acetylmuramoyl-L-alanine amidase